jgi:hypothetical protein
MVAGMSGATAGSGGGVDDPDNEGRLMLPHAPRNTVNAEAIPRLPIVRALRDLIMASPRTKLVDRTIPQPSVKLLPEQ